MEASTDCLKQKINVVVETLGYQQYPTRRVQKINVPRAALEMARIEMSTMDVVVDVEHLQLI